MSSLIPVGSYHIINGNRFWVPNFAYGYIWSTSDCIKEFYSKGKRATKGILILIRRMIDALENGSKKGKC